MASTARAISLHPGRKGFVVGIVNATLRQQVFLDVRDELNRPIASATFEGQGTRVHLTNIFDRRPHWSFGPFNFTATIFVTIRHHRGGNLVDSTMVGPLSVRKNPEPEFPMEFDISTIISEDRDDNSHDDCTVTVLQYRD